MDEECTIYKTADFIGKRWTIVILLELYRGKSKTKRYSQLKMNIPDITPKILSARLKELEKERLISKKVYTDSIPIRCEYGLTKSGVEFIKIVQHLKTWSLKWKVNNKICERVNCKECKI